MVELDVGVAARLGDVAIRDRALGPVLGGGVRRLIRLGRGGPADAEDDGGGQDHDDDGQAHGEGISGMSGLISLWDAWRMSLTPMKDRMIARPVLR